MNKLYAACACLTLVVGGMSRSCFSASAGGKSDFLLPSPVGAYLALAVGDRRAAADIVWLKTVQLLGDSRYLAAGLPHVEAWLDTLTLLDPTFENAYLVASGFLSADPERAPAVDRLLARGERAIPDRFTMPMARGFVAYFGAFDLEAAAHHFEVASTKVGAPPYLTAFAQRLRTTSADCRQLPEFMKLLSTNLATPTPSMRSALVSCVGRQLEQAAARHRLQYGDNADVDELISRNEIPPPPAPAGECWSLATGKALLGPCHP